MNEPRWVAVLDWTVLIFAAIVITFAMSGCYATFAAAVDNTEVELRLYELDERVDSELMGQAMENCQVRGAICKLEKGNSCQTKMENCVINAHRHWKAVRKFKEKR